MPREVSFAPEALADLFELYDYIAADSGAERARQYIDRIVAICGNLVTFPERGTRYDDLRPGLRTTNYRRRVIIACPFTETKVFFDRILFGARSFPALFAEGRDDGARARGPAGVACLPPRRTMPSVIGPVAKVLLGSRHECHRPHPR